MEMDEDLLDSFVEEALENVETIEPNLLRLEGEPGNMELINILFRSIHSIKGGSGFFGFQNMGSLAHKMEALMSKVREAEIVLERRHIDVLLTSADHLHQMIKDPQASEAINVTEDHQRLDALIEGQAEYAKASSPRPEAKASTKVPRVQKFLISAIEVEKIIQGGNHLYAGSVFLNEHLFDQESTPQTYIDVASEFGSFVMTTPPLNEIASLQSAQDDETFTFLFATIMDSDLVFHSLGLSENQGVEIDLQALKEMLSGGHPVHIIVNFDGTETSVQFEATAKQQSREALPAVEEAAETKEQPTEDEPLPEDAPPSTSAVTPAVAQKKMPLKGDESIRVHVSRLNRLIDLAGELVLARNQIMQLSEPIVKEIQGLKSVLQNFNMVTTELQEVIMNTRMQPIGMVFGKFPRIIRQLASNLGKDIQLITKGNEVELDKTIIESLSDPMTHIVRNTADHGIELPEEREKKGKPKKGTLQLKAYHESGQVIIEISDDGKGINAEFIARKAVEKGVITAEMVRQMSTKEKINLVFAPGFSTAEKVTAVSGRGVGMDVVRTNIEQLGGTVEITSVVDKGTTISMVLPLTMAIVSCLIVSSRGQRFAFPQTNLEELVMLKEEDASKMVEKIQGKTVLRLRGKLLPLISLAEGLNLPDRRLGKPPYKEEGNARQKRAHRIMILKAGAGARIGIIVDTILGSEEIVVKPMPEYLKHLPCFSGTTILGDGTISMIMDVVGFTEKNGLLFTKDVVEEEKEEIGKMSHETQSLLLFDNGSMERFAVTIPLIQRVDTINTNQIQYVGDKEYVAYMGEQMRILRLENYIPIQKPTQYSETPSIIIPKKARVPVGILINRVIDSRNIVVKFEKGSIECRGILGSTLIDDKITLLVDLYAVLEMGEPRSLSQTSMENKKVQKRHILLVEDTPFFLSIVKEYLTSVGYQATTAIDGKKGLEALEAGRFDMILSDIEMPEMDGWEFIKAIRANKKWNDIPVIALTSLNDDKTIHAGKEAGFSEWLVKLDKEEILKQLAKYLG
ncbi:hybrid sensor histidine kinase/response regulator [Deltaproteobacteria bacterium TL4]